MDMKKRVQREMNRCGDAEEVRFEKWKGSVCVAQRIYLLS